jgi:TonB family protein
MNSSFVWNNLVTYSLQVGLLVGIAAFVPAMLRFRSPHGKLIYLQLLLAACLLLPLVQPWKHEVASGTVQVTSTVIAVQPSTHTTRKPIPWTQIALVLFAVGAAVRLGWLMTGFRRLSRHRQLARPFPSTGACPTFLSDQIIGPVTFGFRHPVVLLPPTFPALDAGMQRAILCHEFLHVERRDWLFTVAEEVVRAIFWFHPAIWWVLGEIQLTREQAVDLEVVNRTQAREQYVDTLLKIAGARFEPDLAPAPLFLRKRHLKERVVSIFKEVEMSKTKMFSRLVVGLAILVAGCWLVTGSFPLSAAPQDVNDAVGVTVDIGGAALIHRAPVAYPEAARRNHVQGSVSVEMTLDASGNVSDARVLSGPDELRRAVLNSVLQWHYEKGAAGSVRQATITFDWHDTKTGPNVTTQGFFSPGLAGRTLKSIRTTGLSDQTRSQVIAALPVHEGDALTADLIARVQAAVRGVDEHLQVSASMMASGEVAMDISAPNSVGAPGTTPRIKIGGSVQQAKLIKQPRPVYPPDAKTARISGVVHLSAIIGKDGTVQSLEVLGGHPLLVPAALEAVRQWQYQTTLLNGEPVEVQTQIDVNFTLTQ